MPRILPWKLVSRILAGLLLTAAGLKLYGLRIEAVASSGLFSMPEFQIAVVEFELFLAAWLWWGKYPLGSWILGLAAFTCFAGASFYLGWVGQTSCGCFGALHVNPWATFSLDVLVLTGLALARPDLTPLWNNPRRALANAALPAVYGLAGIGLISAILLGLAIFGFGSVAAAIASLRGERISIHPRLADVGAAEIGTDRQVKVEVTNWTDQPVRLIGGTQDCSCTVLADLPVTVPPQQTRSLAVNIRLKGKPGIFTRKAALLVDDDGFKQISFRLTGRILPRDETEEARNASEAGPR